MASELITKIIVLPLTPERLNSLLIVQKLEAILFCDENVVLAPQSVVGLRHARSVSQQVCDRREIL